MGGVGHAVVPSTIMLPHSIVATRLVPTTRGVCTSARGSTNRPGAANEPGETGRLYLNTMVVALIAGKVQSIEQLPPAQLRLGLALAATTAGLPPTRW